MAVNKSVIGTSIIPLAGRGLFLTELVYAGELVFNVPRPWLCVVDGKNLRKTCDECFAYNGVLGTNNPEKTEPFLECKCKVVYYCSETCKANAWKTHHKIECAAYRKIAQTEPEINSLNPQFERRFRLITRLFALKKMGTIPEEDFKLFFDLAQGEEATDAWIEFTIERLYATGLTHMSPSKLRRWIQAVGNNDCEIDTPRILTTEELEGDEPYAKKVEAISLGACVDPYYSMINHSCMPNSYWVFNGRELQVRAERDMVAGEEVTISYIPRGAYVDRTISLASWGIHCTCQRCSKGVIEPTGQLREAIKEALDEQKWKYIRPTAQCRILRTLISDVWCDGNTWGAWPMRLLLVKLHDSLRAADQEWGVLQVLLRLRYSVDDQERPKAFLCERVQTLRLLVSFVGSVYHGRCGSGAGNLVVWIKSLYPYYRRLLLYEVQMCYGEDSALAKWELKRNMEEEGVEQGDEAEEKEIFRRSITLLLTWASKHESLSTS
ncbi:SET domain-containing protein [Mollisia scopiformis]|uniref:SET domain-containing protein n=1 Tax=Mollisia scopiformis TaxID=149040 RepID=A0A194XN48_MOLSC|nr:SET domain-containing protein [Mollisia scopiformis]KUJ21561.1 SET domain-containing protein [Mollisia scopiformis]